MNTPVFVVAVDFRRDPPKVLELTFSDHSRPVPQVPAPGGPTGLSAPWAGVLQP